VLDARVLRSDAQGDAPGGWLTASCDAIELSKHLKRLDERKLGGEGLFDLGRMLAGLLLPTGDGIGGVRELFLRALEKVGVDEYLRLRLVLSTELASLPWEYVYLDRTGGRENMMSGFIGLDPRIAIVRSEPMTSSIELKPMSGDIHVLAALASPIDQEPLDLDVEAKVIHDALQNRQGIEVDVFRDATKSELADRLRGANIFHFAGHGRLKTAVVDQPGVEKGTVSLAFDDGLIDADALGVSLLGGGVRLAVLAGCETGRRVGPYDLGSAAIGLVRANVPAVVANQFAIHDTSAIAFSSAFYNAIDGGLPIESAMQAGRRAIFMKDPNDRDWGVPVLYLRAKSGQLFAGAEDEAVRTAARREVETKVFVDLEDVEEGGFAIGADLQKKLAGKLSVQVEIAKDVAGEAIGARTTGQESAEVHASARTIKKGGSFTGLVVEDDALPKLPGTGRGKGSSTVNVKEMHGGQAVGTQHNQITAHGGIAGREVRIESVTINNAAAAINPDTGLIKESLRLYVARPANVEVNESFEIAVQVKQPASPPLTVEDLEAVSSAEGGILRRSASEAVRYRIVPTGDGFEFSPAQVLLKLHPGEDSPVVYLQGVSRKSGLRSLLVTAYQDDDTFAAQTRIKLQVAIVTRPK
jgi:hypothetical protein